MLSSNNIKNILTGLFNKNKEEHDKDINHLKTNMNKGWISSGTIEELHGISDTSAPFDYYSEEEQLIGQWVDGKPLYRKYVYLGKNQATGTVFSVNDSTSMAIINAVMIINDSSTNFVSTIACDAFYENGKINVISARNWTASNNRLIYAAIEYTKTTDTSIDKKEIVANGINMQLYDGTHYSTNELLIGQWIDGKPLYRKVIPFTLPSTSGITTYSGHLPDDMDFLVSIRGKSSGKWTSNNSMDLFRDFPFYLNASDYISIYVNGRDIYIYLSSSIVQYYVPGAKACFIVEYTKTTDTPFSIDEDIAWVALDSDVNDVLNNIGE